MSIKKTQTLQLDSNDWGSLAPIVNSQPLPTYSLSQEETLIGRNSECSICINDKRLSGKHCLIKKQQGKVTLTDLSTNGTFLGDKRIGKNNTVELKNNCEIWLLTAAKVPVNQTIGFKLILVSAKEQEVQKLKEEEEAKKQADKLKQQEQAKKKEEEEKEKAKRMQADKANSSLAQSIKDQITCSFCYQIMSIPVAVQPCNHRFCGGCLTQLVDSKKDTCIQCRKELTTAVRDAAFTSIIEDYLKSHPDQKRDPKEEEDLKAKNIFGFDPINIHQRIHGKTVEKKKVEKAPVAPRGRARGRVARVSSDLSASDDQKTDKCRECIAARDGFQCGVKQVHVPCHTCGKSIPNRDDPSLHQCCAICTTFYCNLYYPPCKAGTKLIKLQDRRQLCKIDPALMRGNNMQFQIIRDFLKQKKQTSREVFDHMIDVIQKRKFTYIMDRKIMRVPPLASKQVKLVRDSAICDLCWNDLWFQMVFAYRTEITPQLPSHLRDRPVCYWGINCRTMDHNADHARKFNHCIFQTRFS